MAGRRWASEHELALDEVVPAAQFDHEIGNAVAIDVGLDQGAARFLLEAEFARAIRKMSGLRFPRSIMISLGRATERPRDARE